MRYPLDTIFITGEFKEKAVPGTGLKDSAGVARHIGVDFRAAVGTTVYAPGDGVVTQSYTAGSGNQIIEMRIDSYLWRFLHLSERKLKTGDYVREGQIIAKSGNTGGVAPHLHVDTRKDDTTYNASLNNYVDPRSLITPQGGTKVAENKKTDLKVMLAIAEAMHGRNPNDQGNIDDLNKNHLGKDPYDKVLEFFGSEPGHAYRAKIAKAFADQARIPQLETDLRIANEQLKALRESKPTGRGATQKQLDAEKWADDQLAAEQSYANYRAKYLK